MSRMLRRIKFVLQGSLRYMTGEHAVGLAVLLVFFTYVYLAPVRKFSIMMNYPASPWSWICMFSSLYYDLIVLLGAVYLFSKVPFMNRSQMYVFLRMGRAGWIKLQIAKLGICSLIYTLLLFFYSVVVMLPHIEADRGWGKLLYTLALTNASNTVKMSFDVPYRILAEQTPALMIAQVFLVVFLIVFLIGLSMFVISIWTSRTASLLVNTFFCCVPIVIENARKAEQQLLVKIIPTEWIKVTKLGDVNFQGVQSLDFNEVLLRLFIINCGLIVVIFLSRNKIQYRWYGEK